MFPTPLPAKPSRLLMVKLSSLGDVVHALPLLEALRDGLGPNVFIGWAVKKKFAGLLAGNPHLDRVYELQGSAASEIWALGKTLRAERFDTALDTQGLLVSGVVTRLSGASVRVGFDGNREGNQLFLTHPIVPARNQRKHVVDKLMGFCDVLGMPHLVVRPQTYLACGEADAARALLAPLIAKNRTSIVGCIVGASTPDKVWPSERWAEMARLLISEGVSVALLGGRGEMVSAQTVQNVVGESAHLLNLAGKTGDMRTLASLLAQCAVVVGGDSGPTHLAVAVGTPVVGLYGVTDPVRTGPTWGSAPAIVLDFAEADAPPSLRRPRHSTLPDALARIPARAAFEAVQSLLSPVGIVAA